MKKQIFISILLAGFLFSSIYSQGLNKSRFDSLFDILVQKDKAMGSFVLTKNGTVLYKRTIGYSFYTETDKKLSTENTKYRIGSITKMFTATMIFQLIEEGKTSLSTTLDTYFPDIPNASKITIGNLLNHRSGLHNFTDDPDYLNWMLNPKTESEMLAIISKFNVDFQPNEKYSYSNSNFVILGYILEKICKEPYSKVLNDRVIAKIGLKNTSVGGKTNKDSNESFSYHWTKTWTQLPETDMTIPGGAGSIISTPVDLAKFIESLFALKLVSQNSLNQMKTMTDGCGMGMFKIPFYSKSAYGHNGAIDGFVSSIGYFPEDSIAISYCSNGTVYPMNDILIGTLSIYFNYPFSIPKFIPTKVITLDIEEIDKYIGVFSSAQIPLKITFTRENNTLMAQATGQTAFPLEATGTDIFQFEPASIEIVFNADKNGFTLKQGGGNFTFTKDKQ